MATAPWERDKSVTKPWERSQPTSGGNELSVTVPVAPGQIPFNDPVAQANAQQQEADIGRYDDFRKWQLRQLQKTTNPVTGAAMGVFNEIAQPAIGAAALTYGAHDPEFKRKMHSLSDQYQHNTDLMSEARPISTRVGATAPYMVSGPAAQRGYFNLVNKMRPGFWSRNLSGPVMSSLIPGGIEGGAIASLNPQQSGPMGAMFGAGGNLVGQFAVKPFSKQPINLTPYEDSMLKIADDWGVRMMPGAKSGHIGAKQFDDALMKGSKSYAILGHITNEQQSVINRKVLGVAGLDKDYIEPGDLYNHKKVLGKKYNELERKSIPVFDNDSLNDITTSRKAYDDLSPQSNHKWLNELENEFFKIGSRNPTGEIDINDYRGLKNKLEGIVSNYKRIGKLDGEQAARLSVVQDYLAIMKDSMKKLKTEADILKQWDELDSQYAATNFLEKHKILIDGRVNYKKLYNALNTTSPKKMASMSGPWEDMIKAAHLGNYINNSYKPTWGAHHRVNKIMGNRQGRGVIGTVANIFHGTKLLPDAVVNYYAWAYPKRGNWRLPETSTLWGGNAASAYVRGGPLMIDTGITPQEKK